MAISKNTEIEKRLWEAADELRANLKLKSSEYSLPILGLIFLRPVGGGYTWGELPAGFPPFRACQKYYRRLFLSGRFYTMLLALYNHMRLEMCVDPWTLCEAGLFTTTPSQRIALVPKAAPTSENYTALLFMQLARTACAALQRDYKEKQPLYILMPVFKGESRLSTARLPDEDPQIGEPAIQPLEGSLALKKYEAMVHKQKTVDREVARRKACPRSRSPDPAQRPSLEGALSSLLASAAPDSAEALLAALVEFLEGLED